MQKDCFEWKMLHFTCLDQINKNLPQKSDDQSLSDVGKVENLVLIVDVSFDC